MGQSTKKPTRKERKKARKSLATLLRRVRRACKSINQVSDWYDLAKDVEAVVNKNSPTIPAGQRLRLLGALKLPEATMAGVGQACGVLQSELGKTIAGVGASTVAGSVLKAAVTVVLLTAVVAGTAAVFANLSTVDVRIFNHGCGPFDIAQAPFADNSILSLAGLSLPVGAIVSGGNGLITVPPLTMEADNATDADTLSIHGLGLVEIPIPVHGATDILFNGQSLRGVRRTIDLENLRGAHEHVLEVICGG